MDKDALATLQAPLKASYREDPDAALVTLRASGRLGEGVTCSLDTGRAPAEAGLHPATLGRSGDAGVTLSAVVTSRATCWRSAEGDLDVRDAAVSRSVRDPVSRHE